jgi:hypothetical protein
MNIDHCRELCHTDVGVSATTAAGVRKVQEALDLLSRPEVVDYADIADAFTPKDEHGEPCHTEGHQAYLDIGTDITCNCVLCAVMRECGYALIGNRFVRT